MITKKIKPKSDFREILLHTKKLNGKIMRIVDSELGTFDIYEVKMSPEEEKPQRCFEGVK